MSIAIGPKDNVYVGIGLQNINRFNAKGKFLEDFAPRINFESLPKPMCTDQSRRQMYVAVEVDSGSKVFLLNWKIDKF